MFGVGQESLLLPRMHGRMEIRKVKGRTHSKLLSQTYRSASWLYRPKRGPNRAGVVGKPKRW